MFDGIFGDIFDFDGDGKLDCLEQAAELAFIATIIEEEEKKSREDYDEYEDDE